MLSRKVPLGDLGEDRGLLPTYAARAMAGPVPRFELPADSMDPQVAYQIVHDELALDGNPALNLATFVTTWMDGEARSLLEETLDKNAIDWDEYPQTVELQDRCVNMLARLFGAHEGAASVGCATVGSSEAIHLAGLAMKWRWRAARTEMGEGADRPNIVMGANVQVCWEKFARYFDVESRMVPLTDHRFVIGVDEAMEMVDENTIGVVGILGSTYTGEYEPIAALNEALDARCAETGWDVPLHVDAASGGFVAPFLQPDLAWDFRLSRVRSINVSGHKYGLVYPGIGWALWRDHSDLPAELVFQVDYLGGSHANFGLNFSRSASQIAGQYYNFLRLGFAGYRAVMVALSSTARWLATELVGLGVFELVGDPSQLPVVCLRLAGEHPFDVFDISEALRIRGWIVPAYQMAPDAQDVGVLRIVVREGLSRDMAATLVADLADALERLAGRTTVPGGPHGTPPAPTRDTPSIGTPPLPAHPRRPKRPSGRVPGGKTRPVC